MKERIQNEYTDKWAWTLKLKHFNYGDKGSVYGKDLGLGLGLRLIYLRSIEWKIVDVFWMVMVKISRWNKRLKCF